MLNKKMTNLHNYHSVDRPVFATTSSPSTPKPANNKGITAQLTHQY